MKTTKIELSTDQRPFTIVFNDFLETDLLDWNEKRIFIYLKKFSNDEDQCFPSIKTLCRLSQLSKKTVLKALKGLEEKKIITKQSRKNNPQGYKSNLYTLCDNTEMWKCENIEDLKTVVDETELEKSIRILKNAGYTIIKEKEPDSDEPPKVTSESSTRLNHLDVINTTLIPRESQDQLERYTMKDIKELYEYDSLLIQYPEKQTDIDIVFDILYDTLNTQKQTIRVNGEDKSRMVVIGRLMKLQSDDLIYSINKYHEQTERIKNVKAYLLTILYHAKEQSHLDLMNLGHHNGDF